MAKVDTMFPDFTNILPRDGSVEIHKDYEYFPGSGLSVGVAQPLGRSVLTLKRLHPETNLEMPHGVPAGAILRITCRHGFGVREVRKVVGHIIELKDSLNDDPFPGGEVKLIKAYKQSYIDMRLRDLIEKRKVHLVGGRYLKL